MISNEIEFLMKKTICDLITHDIILPSLGEGSLEPKCYGTTFFYLKFFSLDYHDFQFFSLYIDIDAVYIHIYVAHTHTHTHIYICHHHHHVAPPARISLTLSRHFSLSFIASGRSSGLHPVSSHSCCM